MTERQSAPGPATGLGRTLRQWLPLLALAAATALVFAMGWHRYLSFKALGLNYLALRGVIDQSLPLALLAYLASYVAVVSLSLPGASILTLAGGLLFGWKIGAPAAVVGATLGATALFLIVSSSFGTTLAGKAGPFVAKLADGFRENALSYLLFLRLTPVFPFFIVNLVPGLLGVPLSTFVLGTFIGIIPGTFAYALAGSSLGSGLDAVNAQYAACIAQASAGAASACPYTIDFKALVTPELIYAGIALGIVALIPVAHKLWSKRHAAT